MTNTIYSKLLAIAEDLGVSLDDVEPLPDLSLPDLSLDLELEGVEGAAPPYCLPTVAEPQYID